MRPGNELTELYDSLSFLYDSLPAGTESEWKLVLKSVLYGGELLAEDASCYGKQQNERNWGKRKDYVRRHGNGEWITEFSTIEVQEPRKKDQQYVPSGAVFPVAPDSGEVLPAMVSGDEIDRAIALLAEFPAESEADQPGSNIDVLLDSDRVRQARENTHRRVTDNETTVLFVSDTHLGYENREKTRRGKIVSWAHEISSKETIKQIAKIAIEQAVDAIIHTGDVLDHEVDGATLSATESFLAKIEIPVYCIIGSHDHDSVNPQHSDSVDGIAWLSEQVDEGHLTELTTNPTPVAGGPLDAFGISAGNVGIDDVGRYNSREWDPSDIAFGTSSSGPNVLCLHDGLTPYRGSDADVDLDRLLAQSRVSFDCVLIGDEHRPHSEDFESGYYFESQNGTPVFYTGPAVRISRAYREHDAFVTEIIISNDKITAIRHTM